MPRLKILAATLFAFCNAAFAFDHSAYQVQSVDQIIEQGRAIEPERKSGFKLMTPPQKVSFDGELIVLPYTCKTDFLLRSMRVQGFDLERLPPINTCLRIRSPKGEVLISYVQDEVARSSSRKRKRAINFAFIHSIFTSVTQTSCRIFWLANFSANHDACPIARATGSAQTE